jgi:hypothetical protein
VLLLKSTGRVILATIIISITLNNYGKGKCGIKMQEIYEKNTFLLVVPWEGILVKF